MNNKIEKHKEDQSIENSKENFFNRWIRPEIVLSAYLIISGLFFFSTNGFFEYVVRLWITFLMVAFGITHFIIKFNKRVPKKSNWIVYSTVEVVFFCITIYLHFQYSNKAPIILPNSNDVISQPKNISLIQPDTLQQIKKDSLTDIKKSPKPMSILGYIGITNVLLSVSSSHLISARIDYVNLGKIPAYNFDHVATLITNGEPTEEDSLWILNHLNQVGYQGLTLLPTAGITAPYRFGDSSIIFNSNHNFTLLGGFSYKDVNKSLHKIMYCYVCEPNTSIFHPYKRFNTPF